MRVVIDTNVFVSRHLKPESKITKVFEAWKQGVFELVVSEEILAEYQKALLYPHIQKRHQLSEEQVFETIDDLKSLPASYSSNKRLWF